MSKVNKVLIVEDDTFISKMYESKFSDEGFAVDIAGDGEEGLSKALVGEYDVIILDLVLPKLSGSELLQKLRQDEMGKNVDVIVLTNLNDSDEKTKMMNMSVRAFLDKSSLTPSQLVETVNNLS